MTWTEIGAAIVLLGGVLGVLVKYVVPAIKMGDRVKRLEKHEADNLEMIEENAMSNKLLCKAMVALIDNHLTGNDVDNLRIVKSELMDFITRGLV